MRNFKINWEKKYLYGVIITLILAIICGIVLCKITNYNYYLVNYSSEYVYNIYSYNSFSLLISTFLKEAVYLYVCFLLIYFAHKKFLTLPVIFLKCVINVMYCVLFFSCTYGGVLVAVFVYIPSLIISVVIIVIFSCALNCFNKRYLPVIPAVFALFNALCVLLLVNVVFRIIISVV